jgi:hypothetical protein
MDKHEVPEPRLPWHRRFLRYVTHPVTRVAGLVLLHSVALLVIGVLEKVPVLLFLH